MTDHDPIPVRDEAHAPLPSIDNPEFIESHDGVHYLHSIPRRSGGRSPMYEYRRYFDDHGTEWVVMRGASLEEGKDGEPGYPEKTYTRERLNAIKAANAQRLNDAMAKLSTRAAGISSPEADIDTSPEADEFKFSDLRTEKLEEPEKAASVVEFDEDGSIKMPDWMKDDGINSDSGAGGHDTQESDEALEKMMLDTFWNKHAKLVEQVNSAVERTTVDYAFSANQISFSIEGLAKIKGLNPDMVEYLGKVQALCREVSRAGSDPSSEYHRNGTNGLMKIRSMIVRIKKT